MRTKPLLFIIGLACSGALVLAACGGSDSPDSKDPTAVTSDSPTGTTTGATTTAAATATPNKALTAALAIKISPNPVPFSGAPAEAVGCQGRPNTWFWEQTVTETGGVGITITSVNTVVDNNPGNDVNPNYQLAANGSWTRKMNMCFGTSTLSHTVEVTYKGTDANGHAVTISAPVTTLQPK